MMNIDDDSDNNEDKDNVDDGDNNNDDDDGEGRLVAVLGTVHLPSTTFHCFLCTTALQSHNATLQHYFLCTTAWATMHHNATQEGSAAGDFFRCLESISEK